MSFMDKLKAQVKEIADEEKERQQGKADNKKQLDREGRAYCPKCHSTDLSSNKRGLTLTTGIIGRNKIVITCLRCGNKFKPGR